MPNKKGSVVFHQDQLAPYRPRAGGLTEATPDSPAKPTTTAPPPPPTARPLNSNRLVQQQRVPGYVRDFEVGSLSVVGLSGTCDPLDVGRLPIVSSLPETGLE